MKENFSLKRKPPQNIAAGVEQVGISWEEILLFVSTDINFLGEYDEQWLVATDDLLVVFDPKYSSEPLFIFQFKEIEDFRTVNVVGSGLVQLRVAGVWLDLVRYSNRLRYFFDRVLKRLKQIRNGQAVLPDEVDAQDPQRCPKCDLMLEFSGELCPRCVSHRASLYRMLQLMRPYWKPALILMVLLVLGITLDVTWPLLTKFLVDEVLASSDQKPSIKYLEGMSPHALLVLVVSLLASMHTGRAIINVITGRISSRVGNAMTFDIRAKLVQKLEELSLAYYSKQETGSLVGRIAYDTEAIYGFISQITSGFFMQLCLVLISFIIMFSLEPHLALWSIVPTPIIIAGAFIYWRYVHPHFQKYWDRSSKQAGLLNGILSGIRVVKAFAQEDNEFLKFQNYSNEVRVSRATLDRTAAYFYPLMAIVFQVGGWIIWYIGGSRVLNHEITLGTLIAFFGYLSMFYGPLGNLTNLTTWLTQFSTQMHRIFDILDTPTVLPETKDPVALPDLGAGTSGKIEFRDVTFSYVRGYPVLKNINLEFSPGERIGIVGRSGSGKTSIVNLILRFYDVDSGRVLIDGVDVRQISRQDLRGRISTVLQDPFLFRGTLSENILYGKPDATIDEIIAASKAANSHDFVMQHALAYDTSVGERGQELSGGERQRISIARALLRPSSILILDEATSNIDAESERYIQKAVEDISRSRTTIIIAHRLKTLEKCDRIYVIEDGNVLESGTHSELLQMNGKYSEWVRIQQGKNYKTVSSSDSLDAEQVTKPEIRWLNSENDRFERGARRELQVLINNEITYRGAFALRCFPIEHLQKYISIKHISSWNRIEEIGIIKDLAEWPISVQNLIRESLTRRYFLHEITKIFSVRKVAQFLAFSAQTNVGPAEFLVRDTQDSVREFGRKGKLLIDVESNMYVLRNFEHLSRFERKIFQRYVYW